MRSLITLITFLLLPNMVVAQSTQPSFTIAIPFILNAPPYMWRDANTGQMIGSTIDANELIAKKLGYKLNWLFYNPSDNNETIVNAYQSGDLDILLNAVPKGLQEMYLIKVDARVTGVNINAFVPSDSTLANLSISSLPDYKGVSTHMLNNSIKHMEQKHPVLDQLPVLPEAHDLLSAVKVLEQGEADYSIGERAILSIRLRELGIDDKYHVMDPPLGRIETVMHYLPKSDFAQYEQAFVALSKQFYSNGRFTHIKERNMRRYIRENHDQSSQ